MCLQNFEEFEKKYWPMCIPAVPEEKQLIFSQSRFPSEVKKDELFIGNMTNVLSKDYMQLKTLKISTIIYFSPNKFEDLEANFNCVHYKVETFNKDTVCELPEFKEITD